MTYCVTSGGSVTEPKYKNLQNMPQMVVSTKYDGDVFGETVHFTSNIDSLKYKDDSKALDLKMKDKIKKMMNNRLVQLTKGKNKKVDELSIEEVNDLNRQRYTATTIEACYVLEIDKLQGMLEICTGMEEQKVHQAYAFLRSVSPFRDIDDDILLPIITRLGAPKQYKFGEYIHREGDVPKGITIVLNGVC